MSTIKSTPSHAKGLCHGVFRENRLVKNCVSGDHRTKNSPVKVAGAALLRTLTNPRYFTFHQAYKHQGIWSKYNTVEPPVSNHPKFSGR